MLVRQASHWYLPKTTFIPLKSTPSASSNPLLSSGKTGSEHKKAGVGSQNRGAEGQK